MTMLHTVNKSPFEKDSMTSCLRLSADGSSILLIEDDNDFNAYYHTVNDLIQYYNQPYYFKMAKLAFATLASFALNLNMNIIHTLIASTTQSDPIITSAFLLEKEKRIQNDEKHRLFDHQWNRRYG